MKRRSILHACLFGGFNALPVLIIVTALHCGPGQPENPDANLQNNSQIVPETDSNGSIDNPSTLQIQYHLDESGRQNFEDRDSMPWKTAHTDTLMFGFTTARGWLKIQLPENSEAGRYLWVRYSQLDNVSLYVKSGDAFQKSELGDAFPFGQRRFLINTFVFQLPPDIDDEIYLSAYSSGALLLPVYLVNEEQLVRAHQSEVMLFGFYYGFLILIALFNFLLFISIRDSIFGWYALYVLLVFMATFALKGFAFEYFWPDFPDWHNRSFVACVLLYYIPALFFSRKYLQLKRSHPLYDGVLKYLKPVYLAAIIYLLFVDYTSGTRIANPLVVVTALFILIVSAHVMLSGYRPARYFFFAWFFFLTGQIVTGLWFQGYLPHNVFAENYGYIGSAIEVALLSLGLGNRFNQQKKESYAKQVQLTEAYARFVPRQFLTFLKKESIIDVRLGDAVERDMTVLFADIRSFTDLSESMTARENFEFINTFLRTVGPVIRQHNGFIDKYIGDAIMALFPESPEDAVQASIEMRRLLAIYNTRRESRGKQVIRIGIGIHTGRLMLGTIGEEERMEGTVISDTVNLASRLEGLTKHYGVTTILSEQSLFGLADPDKYAYRLIDYVKVKGKVDSVAMIEIFEGDPVEQRALKLSTRGRFERAMHAYLNQDFQGALEIYQSILDLNPADSVVAFSVNRIRRFIEHGIPPDWDGITALDVK